MIVYQSLCCLAWYVFDIDALCSFVFVGPERCIARELDVLAEADVDVVFIIRCINRYAYNLRLFLVLIFLIFLIIFWSKSKVEAQHDQVEFVLDLHRVLGMRIDKHEADCVTFAFVFVARLYLELYTFFDCYVHKLDPALKACLLAIIKTLRAPLLDPEII